ncbi:GDNF family receptor alpha-2-like [Morone saxatilis]|uniref:GDNF family receptor alpha-2-like n=1 Tax=Morone saxatilis TaxID=34816 RepID=UPI0015E1D912|nr:GDNF family receptor alpha-2-like [Morone saxatilis]
MTVSSQSRAFSPGLRKLFQELLAAFHAAVFFPEVSFLSDPSVKVSDIISARRGAVTADEAADCSRSLVFTTVDSSLSKMSPCSEAGKPCNPCLDAAKACNLNETCKRLRSAYNSICSKATPPQPSLANQEPCSRKRCQKALRQFFERVPWELSYPLLFCSCPDQACAERRRRTIVPSCSHQERHKPTCLELRRTCRSDALCRSRLADFHMNCQMTSHTVTSCPHDNYHGCLMSYVGLLGSDVTPNYSDSSPSNITISLWCTCRGTGNQEPECDAFHRDFTHNTCLKNAIQSFGYGAEGGTLLVTEPSSTFLPPAQPPIISKPAPSLHGNAIKPMDSACMFSTCANLQDGGQKCVPSDEFECEECEVEDEVKGDTSTQGRVGRFLLCSHLPADFIICRLTASLLCILFISALRRPQRPSLSCSSGDEEPVEPLLHVELLSKARSACVTPAASSSSILLQKPAHTVRSLSVHKFRHSFITVIPDGHLLTQSQSP